LESGYAVAGYQVGLSYVNRIMEGYRSALSGIDNKANVRIWQIVTDRIIEKFI
jgi:hypothetical protein